MKLSPHFLLDEFTVSQEAARLGLSNTPPVSAVNNLRKLAETMEQVRELLGQPIIVSSGYRAPRVNKAIGGSRRSAHMQGLACDFICPRFGTPLAVAKEIAGSIIEFDQLIHEFGRWVHIGLAEVPRRQLLSAHTVGGKTKYSIGLV